MNTNHDLIQELEAMAGEPFTLSRFLLAIRQEQGLSQVEFAKTLKVSKQFICDLEHDRRAISPKVAEAFALQLGYSPKQFIRLCLQDLLNKQGLHYAIDIQHVA